MRSKISSGSSSAGHGGASVPLRVSLLPKDISFAALPCSGVMAGEVAVFLRLEGDKLLITAATRALFSINHYCDCWKENMLWHGLCIPGAKVALCCEVQGGVGHPEIKEWRCRSVDALAMRRDVNNRRVGVLIPWLHSIPLCAGDSQFTFWR